MTERWKPVSGYEGYKVSNLGRVKRVADGQGAVVGRILKLQVTSDGRSLMASLCERGMQKWFLVHRLVLEAFVGPCPEGCECNHKDGDPKNNHLENLEWVTALENMRHAIEVLGSYLGRHVGSSNPSAKLTENAVREIRRLYKVGEWSTCELADIYGISQSGVAKIVRRETWKHI